MPSHTMVYMFVAAAVVADAGVAIMWLVIAEITIASMLSNGCVAVLVVVVVVVVVFVTVVVVVVNSDTL